MNSTSDKNEFIVVYPDAIDHRWLFLDKKIVQKEITYFRSLLDHLKQEYIIDSTRIYVSGMSGGGIFSIVLSHVFPGEFAAICVVAGNMIRFEQFPVPLVDETPIPLLLIHGTSDHIYNGTDDLFSVDETLEYWIRKNNCDSVPQVTLVPDINQKDKSTVSKQFYSSRGDSDVVFYKIENGGHHWPNSLFDANRFVKRDLGILNKDFDTNQAIWHFVSGYEIE